jgi:modulator of FtsH protease HflC
MILRELWLNNRPALLLTVGALLALFSSVVIVPETEQAVVIRLGQPHRIINRFKPGVDYGATGAGVSFRIPFAESLVRVSRQVLALDLDTQTVLSNDQRPLQVDAFARYRVIDPRRLVQTAGNTDRLGDQLKPILSSVLRQELGKRTFQSMLTAERGIAMQRIRDGLDHEARRYGAQVIDVRIKRADIPDGNPLESTFAQMRAARGQAATEIRAQGEKRALIIQAEADANAARIYADSYGRDPQFYDFFRAMRSYRTTFANPENKSASTIILSPDNDYLRQFQGH